MRTARTMPPHSFTLCSYNMDKFISSFIKSSAIFLFIMATIFFVNFHVTADIKTGPVSWWFTILSIIVVFIPSLTLFMIPNARNYKKYVKIIMVLILAPALVVVMVNSYDWFISLTRGSYREGFLYIFSFFLATVTTLLGYLKLLIKNF